MHLPCGKMIYTMAPRSYFKNSFGHCRRFATWFCPASLNFFNLMMYFDPFLTFHSGDAKKKKECKRGKEANLTSQDFFQLN